MKNFVTRVMLGVPVTLLALQGASYYFFGEPVDMVNSPGRFVLCAVVVGIAGVLNDLGEKFHG